MSKKYYLGIDTGGTHTDAVIYDPKSKEVLVTAKAVTTHHNLVEGITEALNGLKKLSWDGGLKAVKRIHLSTTLATNSIAENLGHRVGLILMGYDQDHDTVRRLLTELPQVTPVFVEGRYNFYGHEEVPLDLKAVEKAIKSLDQGVSGWAVSGLFSVKNPAHELTVMDIIKKMSKKPVTRGSELTGRLNAPRRAATAALNAGLVVIIGRLLDAVKAAAKVVGLAHARLMVVKGDGTLASEEWAREKPIETVVSGPAAGLVGARLLCRGFLKESERDLWVMDVGGTTCDLAFVQDGLPAVNPDGAKVGAWETMTMAVETRTRGLGGDSLVTFDSSGNITLGPRRVLPLCRLARLWPKVLSVLRYQANVATPPTIGACFFVPGSPPEPGMSRDEMNVLEALKREVPFSMAKFSEEAFESEHHFMGLMALEHPSILISTFTPTDAMSILGLYGHGNREAAQLGAEVLGRFLNWDAETMARRVLAEFGRVMAMEIVSYGFSRNKVKFDSSQFTEDGAFGGALGRREHGHIELKFRAKETVVLLGAPVGVLAPFLEENLSARFLVPPSFDVASAAGAAASPVHLTRRVDINALPYFAGYRVFLPDHVEDDGDPEKLVTLALDYMDKYLRSLAKLAGENYPCITVTREDRIVILRGAETVNMGVTLLFTVSSTEDTN